MRNRGKRLTFLAVVALIGTVLEVPVISYLISRHPAMSDFLPAVGPLVLIPVAFLGVFFWLNMALLNAGQARLHAQHPGALIMRTIWNSSFADTFLRSGQRPLSVPGVGFYVGLVVDSPGIKVFFMTRHPRLFGIIPWESVRSVHIGQASLSLFSRRTGPTLVIDHEGDQGPLTSRIVLLITGKEAKASASELPGMIMARRPA